MNLFVGEISLNFSLSIYLVWLLPQLILNFKRQTTQGLSLSLHALLFTGYLSDLLYGFGCHMQWQYRIVTLIGLSCLIVQHLQFRYYGLAANEKFGYLLFNIGIIIGSLTILIILIHFKSNRLLFDSAGLIANFCWFSYAFPQIIKNYRQQSTVALSLIFIILGIISNICDTVSAWSLDWDYPSKIGAPISLVENLILLIQIRYYARSRVFKPMAINC